MGARHKTKNDMKEPIIILRGVKLVALHDAVIREGWRITQEYQEHPNKRTWACLIASNVLLRAVRDAIAKYEHPGRCKTIVGLNDLAAMRAAASCLYRVCELSTTLRIEKALCDAMTGFDIPLPSVCMEC